MRLNRFVGSQKSCGVGSNIGDIDDTKTSMSEIVKRFFNNEPIPEMLGQNEVYDYDEETITHNVKHFDENGEPVKDKQGNIITEEVLNSEILNLVPIHPNFEDIDSHGDNDELGRIYGDANDKLGAFQRVQAQKLEDAKAQATSDAIKIATENGYVKQTDNLKSE